MPPPKKVPRTTQSSPGATVAAGPTGGSQLPNFPTDKQSFPNGCWVTTGRMMQNYLVANNKQKPGSTSFLDEAKAAILAGSTPFKIKGGLDVLQRNPEDFLVKIGRKKMAMMGYDSAVPTQMEIKSDMQNGYPIFSKVTEKPAPRTDAARKVDKRNGHWVVITGINGNGSELSVFDPAKGTISQVPYDKERCDLNGTNWYWCNSTVLLQGIVPQPASSSSTAAAANSVSTSPSGSVSPTPAPAAASSPTQPAASASRKRKAAAPPNP